MRTSIARRIGVTAAVLGVALVASACGGGGYKTQTLTFSEKETDNNGFVSHLGPPTVKFGPQGPETLSAGDILSFSSDFVDSSKKKVGEINGTCSVTRPGPFEKATATCTATASLPGGSLILAAGGTTFAAGTFIGAIIGGTGKYAGAGGTFTVKQTGDNSPSIDTFHIQIPKK